MRRVQLFKIHNIFNLMGLRVCLNKMRFRKDTLKVAFKKEKMCMNIKGNKNIQKKLNIQVKILQNRKQKKKIYKEMTMMRGQMKNKKNIQNKILTRMMLIKNLNNHSNKKNINTSSNYIQKGSLNKKKRMKLMESTLLLMKQKDN